MATRKQTELTTQRLPKGIRRKGNDNYEFSITVNGARQYFNFKSLEEAVIARHYLTEAAEKENGLENVSKRFKLTVYPLRDALEAAITYRWNDTKGEKDAVRNATEAVEFFGPNEDISTVTTERVNAFISHLQSKGNGKASINRKLSALSIVLKVAESLGKATAKPTMMRMKEYRGRERYLSQEEENTMLELLTQWKEIKARDFIICLIDLGCRCGELTALTKIDLNFEQGVYGTASFWRTKNNHPRTVPMTQRVAEIMERRSAPITLNARLFHHTPTWIRYTWSRLKQEMGLTNDSQFVPHCLRHTCASRLIQAGVPIPDVKQWLGHESIQSTMRYAHLAPTTLYGLVDVLSASKDKQRETATCSIQNDATE